METLLLDALSDDAILLQYLLDELDKRLKKPLFSLVSVHMIIIWRKGPLTNTRVMEIQPKDGFVWYQRIVPRYVGSPMRLNAADPELVDKVIAELYGKNVS